MFYVLLFYETFIVSKGSDEVDRQGFDPFALFWEFMSFFLLLAFFVVFFTFVNRLAAMCLIWALLMNFYAYVSEGGGTKKQMYSFIHSRI